jgi:hypothetical protein
MLRLGCVEGERFSVKTLPAEQLRRAGSRLQRQLGTRLPPVREENGNFFIQGIVGTIEVGGILLEISPKTRPGTDWVRSVLDLLTNADRIEPAGERSAGVVPARHGLLDALATIYARRLESAINRDGPILTLDRHRRFSRRVNGKLNASKWALSAAWKPHVFPVTRTRLTSDNDFCHAMASVADGLKLVSTLPDVRRALGRCASALCPEAWERDKWSPTVISRTLPSQWGAFMPAWNLCVSILRRRSPLGASGSHQGISIAIEAWPLLESLLARALRACVRNLAMDGRDVTIGSKSEVPLLKAASAGIRGRSVIADGRLLENNRTIATFEAKYKVGEGSDSVPREDVFQALCTAAACNAPLAVLVYPDSRAPAIWDVPVMHGTPQKLAVIGLDLYGYRSGVGDDARGQLVAGLLRELG